MGTAQGKILQGLRPLLQAPSGLHYVFVCENQALNAKVDQGQRMSVSNVDAAYIKANLLSMNCLVQSMGDRADIWPPPRLHIGQATRTHTRTRTRTLAYTHELFVHQLLVS